MPSRRPSHRLPSTGSSGSDESDEGRHRGASGPGAHHSLGARSTAAFARPRPYQDSIYTSQTDSSTDEEVDQASRPLAPSGPARPTGDGAPRMRGSIAFKARLWADSSSRESNEKKNPRRRKRQWEMRNGAGAGATSEASVSHAQAPEDDTGGNSGCKWIILVVVILVLVGAGVGGYFLYENYEFNASSVSTTSVADTPADTPTTAAATTAEDDTEPATTSNTASQTTDAGDSDNPANAGLSATSASASASAGSGASGLASMTTSASLARGSGRASGTASPANSDGGGIFNTGRSKSHGGDAISRSASASREDGGGAKKSATDSGASASLTITGAARASQTGTSSNYANGLDTSCTGSAECAFVSAYSSKLVNDLSSFEEGYSDELETKDGTTSFGSAAETAFEELVMTDMAWAVSEASVMGVTLDGDDSIQTGARDDYLTTDIGSPTATAQGRGDGGGDDEPSSTTRSRMGPSPDNTELTMNKRQPTITLAPRR